MQTLVNSALGYRLAMLLNVCLVAGLGYAAFWTFAKQPDVLSIPEFKTVEQVAAVQTKRMEPYSTYSIIASRLQPVVKKPPVKKPPVTKAPTKTPVRAPLAAAPAAPIKLLGTVADPTLPAAFIQIKEQQQVVYVGDKFGETEKGPKDYSVIRIIPGELHVTYKGKTLDAIILKKDDKFAKPAARSTPLPGVNVQAQAPVKKADVNKLVADPALLITSLGPMPVFDTSGFVGIKVSKVDPESLFAGRGIVPGDVITSINNIKTDPANAFKLFDQLPKAKIFTINFLRGKQRMTRSFRIQ